MPYDITFVRRLPGRTVAESLDLRNAAFDPEAEPEPMSLTPGQRAAWEEVVRRVGAEVGPVVTEEFRYGLTLERNGDVGRVQLDYDGESAEIALAYRHDGEAARRIVAEAYRMADIVEDVTGLTGVDCQTGRPTAEGDVDAAVGHLTGVSRWAQGEIPRLLAEG